MHKTVHLRWQLKAGVSTAAMMAAAVAFMPGDARAQSCTVTNNLQGVADGTVVTCPSSDQLAFPGAVDQGPFTVPNGSTLFAVSDGTNPVHQQWGFTDPSGNTTFVFLSGKYDLVNGIGGTTLLEGSALLSLAGAGSCGVGGLVCPGFGDASGYNGSNITDLSAPGSGSNVIYPVGTYPPVTDPGASGGLAGNVFDGSDCGQSSACGGSPFFYGPTGTTSSLTEAVFTRGFGGDITIHGVGFTDDVLGADGPSTVAFVPLSEAPFVGSTTLTGETVSIGGSSDSPEDLFGGPEFATSITGGGNLEVDPQVRENFEACEANFGDCSLIVNEGGGSVVFHFPPTVASDPDSVVGGTTITAGSTSLTIVGRGFEEFDDGIGAFETPKLIIPVPQSIGSGEGGGVMMLGGAVLDEGNQSFLVDAASLVEAHRRADELLENQMNQAGPGTGGASSSFSYPSTDGSFLFTANGSQFGVITPVPPAGSTTIQSETGLQVHFDVDVSGPPGGQGVDTTVAVQNQGDRGTSFVLTFSEAMDKDVVEGNFTIRSFDSTIVALDGGTISGNTATPDSSNIWDQSEIDVDWNSDNTEVTFTFPEPQLPDGQVTDGAGANEQLLAPGAILISNQSQENSGYIEGNRDHGYSNDALEFRVESENANSILKGINLFPTGSEILSLPVEKISILTDLQTVGTPKFEYADGFESGNVSSWSPPEDP